jgi:hypothetical protein
MMLWAERSSIEPMPKTASSEVVSKLAGKTADIIDFAKGQYLAAKNTRPMRMDSEAEDSWNMVYRALVWPEATELLTSLMERSAPYALRLAMIFALTDKSLVIEVKHLRAALAWVRYFRESVRFVFTAACDIEKAEATANHATQIQRYLKGKAKGASRTDIYRKCFGHRVHASQIDDAIKRLLMENPPLIEVSVIPRAGDKKGRSFILSGNQHSLMVI